MQEWGDWWLGGGYFGRKLGALARFLGLNPITAVEIGLAGGAAGEYVDTQLGRILCSIFNRGPK
ncbi:hypothetical protein [Aequorivita echinoideorum]|uniref:Uncharacterized protein n=1 Tax=Aequorivita echinoideorum TaxID=1549647 RepID=A0ABS5S2Y2_9FLAO|nr:hypothetical protein [Aequorivita echinoideorum]MBT0607558.1 hypothetical protein [Aequorivita echinoideorum]